MTRRMSGLLDWLRWISAILVVISHTADLMVARFANTPAPLKSAAVYVWILTAGFGHQAVTVFYVLSGLLVGGPLFRIVQREGAIPWKKYFVDRIIRIHLVLIPALLACFIFDRISYRIEPGWVAEFIYGHSGWRIFFGNLLSLQNFYVPFFGSDGPIGTLAIEMWFYICFPLLLAPLCSQYSIRTRTLLVLLAVGIIAALGYAQPAFLYGFVIWGIGVAARLWSKPLFNSPRAPTVLFVLSLVIIRVTMRREMAQHLSELFIADLLLATTLFLLLSTLNHLPEAKHSLFFWSGHKQLASLSYSLYATHTPLLFLLTGLCKVNFGFGIHDLVVRPAQWLIVLSTILTCVAFAFLFSQLTERHTAPLRRWVLANMGSS